MSSTLESTNPNATQAPRLIAVSASLWGVAFITLVLRYFSRKSTGAKLWWDDWTSALALLLVTAYDCIQAANTQNGFGRHINTINPTLITPLLKLVYIAEMIYLCVITTARLSWLCFLWRIFHLTYSRAEHWFFWFLFTSVWAWLLGGICAGLFGCRPIAASWDPQAGKCTPLHVVWLAMAVPNMLLDVLSLAFPLHAVFNLQVSRAKRTGLCFVFLIGAVATVVSMYRAYIAWNYDDQALDISWNLTPMGIWTAVEIQLVMICLNVASTGHLVGLAWKRVKRSWPARGGRRQEGDSGEVRLNVLDERGRRMESGEESEV